MAVTRKTIKQYIGNAQSADANPRVAKCLKKVEFKQNRVLLQVKTALWFLFLVQIERLTSILTMSR